MTSKELGNGLRLTRGEDGIFLHVTDPGGNKAGICLEGDKIPEAFLTWATGLLNVKNANGQEVMCVHYGDCPHPLNTCQEDEPWSKCKHFSVRNGLLYR